MQNKSNKVIK